MDVEEDLLAGILGEHTSPGPVESKKSLDVQFRNGDDDLFRTFAEQAEDTFSEQEEFDEDEEFETEGQGHEQGQFNSHEGQGHEQGQFNSHEGQGHEQYEDQELFQDQFEEQGQDEDKSTKTIFVSIPSYRDPDCPNTLANLFQAATFPDRLLVGVCQQNTAQDIDCMQGYGLQQRSNQIKIVRMSALDAKGPMFARYVIENELYEPCDYRLMIDSHMRFAKGWDVALINQLHQCNSSKPILTCYPNDFKQQAVKQAMASDMPTFLRLHNFDKRTKFPLKSRLSYQSYPQEPHKSLFWAAGFNFTFGSAGEEVPYDPNTNFVFLGEEASMAVRLWTHGWDFFTPPRTFVYHCGDRSYRPVFWELVGSKRQDGLKVAQKLKQERTFTRSNAEARLWRLFTGDNLEAPFGLGTERNLAEFYNFVGVNYHTKEKAVRVHQGLSLEAEPAEIMSKFGVHELVDPRAATRLKAANRYKQQQKVTGSRKVMGKWKYAKTSNQPVRKPTRTRKRVASARKPAPARKTTGPRVPSRRVVRNQRR